MNQWPKPSSTPVIDPVSGKLTAAFSDPIVHFTGRYVDSHGIKEWQASNGVVRTIRARTIRVAGGRTYMQLGNMLGAYSDLFGRLNRGEAMIPVTEFSADGKSPRRDDGLPELFLRPDQYFNAETAGLQIFSNDGQDRLYSYDVDDRGLVYLANTQYGWIIVRDTGFVAGAGGASNFPVLSHTNPTDVQPWRVLSSIRSGDSYFLIVSGEAGPSELWDVSDPSSPVRRADLPWTVKEFAKLSDGTIAAVHADFTVHFYRPSAVVSGFTGSVQSAPPGYIYESVATDGEIVYAVARNFSTGATRITVLKRNASGTFSGVETEILHSFVNRVAIRYGAGYLAVFGQQATGANLMLFDAATLIEIPTSDYFARYYAHNSEPGFIVPTGCGVDPVTMGDVAFHQEGDKTYLLVAAYGLGDVYELRSIGAPPPPPPPSELRAAFIVSPSSPIAGTLVSFIDQSTAGSFFDRLWMFGDGEQSTSVSPNHIYASPGSYAVTLTVSVGGKQATTSKTIVVAAAPPPPPPPPAEKPSLTKSNCYIGDLVDTAKVGDSVYMRVQSIGWRITDEVITWAFGDGTPAVIPSDPLGALSHIWSTPGPYTVILTVTRGAQTLVDMKSIMITGGAKDPPPPPPPPPTDGGTIDITAVQAQLDAAAAAIAKASALLVVVKPEQPRMRLGVCEVPYVWHGWLPPQPTIDSWRALRAAGCTDVRLVFDLSIASPTPSVWDTSLFEKWLRPACAAGLRIEANLIIGGYDPVQIITPPPAHHTAEFYRASAARLVKEFDAFIDSYALGNEPGGGPWMKNDVALDGTVDYIREVYFPTFIVPLHGGIRSVKPNAIISGFEAESPAIQLRCLEAAKESGVKIDAESIHPYGDVGGGDYATLKLFHEVYLRDPSRPWFIGEISAGELNKSPSEAGTEQLVDFARTVATSYPDCKAIYLTSPEFLFTRLPAPGSDVLEFPPGTRNMMYGVTWSTFTFGAPTPSASGKRLAAVFAESGSRRRVVKS